MWFDNGVRRSLRALGVAVTLVSCAVTALAGAAAGAGGSGDIGNAVGPLGPNVLLGPTVRPSLLIGENRRALSIASAGATSLLAWPVRSQDDDVPGIALARSADGGATWSAPTIVESGQVGGMTIFDAHSHAVAGDGSGRWVVVWIGPVHPENANPAVTIYSASQDDGATWSAPARLLPAAEGPSIIRPSVAWLGADTWAVVVRTPGVSPTASLVRSFDGGLTWSAPMPIDGSFAGGPAVLASDGAGAVLVGWQQSQALLAALSVDFGETWSAPSTIMGNSGGPTNLTQFALAQDGRDGWMAVWRRSMSQFYLPITVETSRSDDGLSWGDPIVVHQREPGESLGTPALGAASGRAVITWAATDSRSTGTDLDIFAIESVDGGATWGERVVVNAGARGDRSDQIYPTVAATSGGWVVGWVTEPGRAAHPVRTVSARGFGLDAPCGLRIGLRRADDCDGDGADDACAIALGWLDDCAGVGTPDGCAIADGLLADCDGDGVPDSCAIAKGLVDDCDGDGVPDTCQLADYEHADGFGWWNFVGGHRDYTIMERFDRRAGVDVLTAVELRILLPPGSPTGTALLCVWSDPIGDGNPSDAQLLGAVEFVPEEVFPTGLQIIEIPPIDLTTLPTDNFFVGVVSTGVRSLVHFVEGEPTARAGTAFFSLTLPGETDPADLGGTALLRRLTDATIHFHLRAIAQSSHDLNGDGILDACQVVGDLNGDGVVDGADLGILLLAWGSDGGPAFADLNGDGVVDGVDLGILLGNWTAR